MQLKIPCDADGGEEKSLAHFFSLLLAFFSSAQHPAYSAKDLHNGMRVKLAGIKKKRERAAVK